MNPMNQSLFTVFVILIFIAIAIQAGILLALFVAFRKTSSRMEALAGQAAPVLESARQILAESGPQLREITANLAETTLRMKNQVERVDATVHDLVDRSRLQIIRVDELVSQTLDKVEETTEMVQETVVRPVKQVAGILQGISVALGAYLGMRRRPSHHSGSLEDEELFI